MSRSVRALLILAVASGMAGCATTHAQVTALPSTIETPAPPPRVVIPEILEAEAPPPAPPPAPAPVEPAPTRPSRPTTTPRPPAQADPPPTTPAPAPENPPVLQTATAGDAGQIEQRTKTKLSAARRDLLDIKYAELSAEAKAQYDRANGLIRQAESALRVKNYPFAEELAGKAATLASQLRKFNDPISF